MPAGGQLGSGVKVAYAIATPHSWVAVPQILSVAIPNITRDRVETTIHGITSTRSYIPGLADVSDAELELLVNLDDGGVHLGLKDFEQSQASIWWRFEVPRTASLGTTDYFAIQILGRVSKWELDTPIDDRKALNVTVQFEGSYMSQHPMTSQFA